MTLRKLVFSLLASLAASEANAQRFAPTWDSVDSRPTPAWWSDAKFGIFIHWGVYSVPAFAPKGEYAEWYWERLGKPGNPTPRPRMRRSARETRAFHERVYGKDFDYRDFAPQFTAEMFDADQWADIFAALGREVRGAGVQAPRRLRAVAFARSGRELGPPVECGRRRAETRPRRRAHRRGAAPEPRNGFLFLAVRVVQPAAGLPATWTPTSKRHLFPQFKDLVTRYSPSVIFSDGEWELPSEQWRAPELLAWLFNDSPVAQQRGGQRSLGPRDAP